jgi:hypothetical protein
VSATELAAIDKAAAVDDRTISDFARLKILKAIGFKTARQKGDRQ